jgi:hypothetical protein
MLPSIAVTYTSPNATGSLRFTPVILGTAHITVTLRDCGPDLTFNTSDDQTTTRTFTVSTSPAAARAAASAVAPATSPAAGRATIAVSPNRPVKKKSVAVLPKSHALTTKDARKTAVSGPSSPARARTVDAALLGLLASRGGGHWTPRSGQAKEHKPADVVFADYV